MTALALVPPAAAGGVDVGDVVVIDGEELTAIACPGCPAADGLCVVCLGRGRVLIHTELIDIPGAVDRWRYWHARDAAARRVPMAARLQDSGLVAYGTWSGRRYRLRSVARRHLTLVSPLQPQLQLEVGAPA